MFKEGSRLFAFIISLLIASFLWLLIRLSEDYKETSVFPLVIKTQFNNKIIIDQPFKTVSITYKTKGFKLFFNNFNGNKPIEINLQKNIPDKLVENDSYKTKIILSDYIYRMTEKLGLSKDIISVSPDTVTLYFQKIYSKNLPVHINLSLKFEKQFELYKSIIYKPDSILITGLKKDIDKITTLETEYKYINGLNKSQYLTLKIIKPKNSVSIKPDRILTYINVEKYTESSVSVPVTVINNHYHHTFKIFPDKVDVTYLVCLKDYKKISPLMFVTAIDYKTLLVDKDHNSTNNAKVLLINYPDFVSIVNVNPQKVEYVMW